MIEVTNENFEDEIIYSELPVVVDFWAPWCNPCRAFLPILQRIEKEYEGKIKFCCCNVEKNRAVAELLNVKAIPTLIFFCDGKIVERISGVYPKDDLKERLDKLIKKC